MTAHPNAILQGQDVNDLHDETGNHFIATMLKTAKLGQIAQIHYLFPRPGSMTATAKTTCYTRAADQVCGAGVYDGDAASATATTPEARVTQLRQRLSAEIPASLSGEWSEFLAVLDEEDSFRAAAFAKARENVHKARENVHAAETVLATPYKAADR